MASRPTNGFLWLQQQQQRPQQPLQGQDEEGEEDAGRMSSPPALRSATLRDESYSRDYQSLQTQNHGLFLQTVEPSSSWSAFFHRPPPLLPPPPPFPPLLNQHHPLETGFHLVSDPGLLDQLQENQSFYSSLLMRDGEEEREKFSGFNGSNRSTASDLSFFSQFPDTHLLPLAETTAGSGGGTAALNLPMGFQDFQCSVDSLFLNNNGAKALRPLEAFPPIDAQVQPTLHQKRAAFRQEEGKGKRAIEEEEQGLGKVREMGNEEDEGSMGASGLIYDSDEGKEGYDHIMAEGSLGDYGGSVSNAQQSSSVTGGDRRGKKKGMPAKNLMAERRRRKKLNDRLYMLRSVVPKISKMDRASILADAVEYLKELLQRIKNLHDELESIPPTPSHPSVTNCHPSTPSLQTFSTSIKNELCGGSLPSPNNHPARVDVRLREGRAVNIHMFCARRPGLLLSTMRALDNLGLDVQQAVISCFNGFALDVFQAEQCGDDLEVLPEQIKAILLDTAASHCIV